MHHEMALTLAFSLMPGIPSSNARTRLRLKKSTIDGNFLGNYHAKQLDEIGSFTTLKKVFDDFYYGKGSTYPDIFWR